MEQYQFNFIKLSHIFESFSPISPSILIYRQAPMALRSIVLWGVLIACQNVNLAVGNGGYCYSNKDNSTCGPEYWPGLCTKGEQQSPINFPPLYPCFKNATIATLVLSKSCYELQKFNITNNGNYVEMKLENPCVMTGSLFADDGTVACDSVRFHWGVNRSVGSEHRLQNDSRAMEAQIGCHNIKFNSTSEARKSGQKGAVKNFALLFSEQYSSDTNASKPIVDCLPKIRGAGMTTQGFGFNMSYFMDIDNNYNKFDCMKYHGSFTYPSPDDCYEIVEWIVKRVTIEILNKWMDEFRKLEGKSGEVIEINSREPQELYGRVFECLRIFGVQLEGKNGQSSGGSPNAVVPSVPSIKPNKVLPSKII